MSYFESVYNIAKMIHSLKGKAYVYALNGARAELEEQFPHMTKIQIAVDTTAAIDIMNGMSLAGDDLEELDLNAFDLDTPI